MISASAPEQSDKNTRTRHGTRTAPVRTKIPSSGSHAIGALERKLQETLGQLKVLDEAEYDWEGTYGYDLAEKYEFELRARLQASLVSLENSIRLLDPSWDRKCLMTPKVKRHTRPMFERAKFQSALISLLGGAPEPLTIRELVERLAPQLGLESPTTDQRRRLRGMTYESLRRAYDKGFVDSIGRPARWFARNSHSEGDIVER